MSESTETKVARVEEQVKGIKEDLSTFRTEVLRQFQSLGEKMDGLDAKYATKEELKEIKKIATTRLWQAVALTSVLSILMTSLVAWAIAQSLP